MSQTAAAAKPAHGLAEKKARLLDIIKQKSFRRGQFKLASGATSDYYLDMKPTMFDAEGAALCADLLFSMLASDTDVDSVGGLELGSVPIVAAVCARSWPERPVSGFVVRKEKKDHGTQQKIDGNFRAGQNVILFEDVTTKGGSVMQAVRAVRDQGGKVKKILTVVDRLEGAEENLKAEGIVLQPVFTTKDLMA